ncbi:MAG: hypothetical protein OXM57_08690 [bacterium]|nr:hypothetical protein [bacterium]MDE0352756.1 hypothetical protein [bacterium]
MRGLAAWWLGVLVVSGRVVAGVADFSVFGGVAAMGEAGPAADRRHGAVPGHRPCWPPASYRSGVGFHVSSRDHTQQARSVRLALVRFQAPSHRPHQVSWSLRAK